MEALIEADYDKRGYRGLLAESWEMKGNKLQFSLRKGVRFHDGTPFTAKDVIASYKRILTDKQSLMAPNLRNIKEMETPDDLTVILTLKKVDATPWRISQTGDHEAGMAERWASRQPLGPVRLVVS
jgi:peptide/nickel transport system substrate-binding protein